MATSDVSLKARTFPVNKGPTEEESVATHARGGDLAFSPFTKRFLTVVE